MARGSLSKVRWKNDRVKKTKERAKRVAQEKGEARKGEDRKGEDRKG
ncbi:MAG: hypothetical protein ACR2H3_15070 [Acidimicrobiales bacterium]